MVQAQQSNGPRAATIDPPRTFTIKRGATAAQDLSVLVNSGFHINSDKPKDEFIIPLKLTWISGPLTTKKVSYPPAEDLKLAGQDLSVFTGQFKIQTEFSAPANAQPGIAMMLGKLRYQACNDRMCLRPVTADVQLPVSIQ